MTSSQSRYGVLSTTLKVSAGRKQKPKDEVLQAEAALGYRDVVGTGATWK